MVPLSHGGKKESLPRLNVTMIERVVMKEGKKKK